MKPTLATEVHTRLSTGAVEARAVQDAALGRQGGVDHEDIVAVLDEIARDVAAVPKADDLRAERFDLRDRLDGRHDRVATGAEGGAELLTGVIGSLTRGRPAWRTLH